MSTGLMATIGVFVLVGLFALIILYDRKRIKEDVAPKIPTGPKLSPTQMWDRHIDELRKRGA
jgi:FtsH-binding integral membrane protein